MSTEKTRRIKDNVILSLWMILLAAFFSFLFYRQAIMYNGEYLSDLPAVIDRAISGKTWSLLSMVISMLMNATDGFLYSVALFAGFIAALTWMFTSLFIEKILSCRRWEAMLCALMPMFLTSIRAIPMFRRLYAGSIVAQPWHNINYLAMRMFAVPAMFFFVELCRICREEKRISAKHAVLTGIMAFLATLMKTGFIMVFAVTLLIFLTADCLRKEISLKQAFLVGLTAVPSVILLFAEYHILRTEDPGYHIIAGLSAFFFQESVRAFIMKFVTGLFLPVMVLWYNRKKLSRGMIFVYAGYAVSILEAMFLMESGDRLSSGSFLWGMQMFAFLLYMYLVPVFVKNAKEYVKGLGRKKPDLYHCAYFVIGTGLLMVHAAYGLRYYYYLMRGLNYYL